MPLTKIVFVFATLLCCNLPPRVARSQSAQSRPAQSRPVKKAATLDVKLEVGRAEMKGFYAGLGTAGLIGAPQLMAISYIPIRFGAHIIGQSGGPHPFAMVLLLPVFGSGLLTVGLGVTEVVLSAYTLNKHKGPVPDHPLVRRAHSAGKLRGLGYGLAAHGALTALVAGPMLALPDELMGDLFGSPMAGKVILGVGLGLGIAQAVAGGVLAYTGHSRMADILQRAAVTPVALPGGGGIGVMGRF